MSLPSRGAWIEINPGDTFYKYQLSLPSRGAWIEIADEVVKLIDGAVSLPSRGAWIEMAGTGAAAGIVAPSLPSRGAWIEIGRTPPTYLCPARRSPHGERGLKF